MDEFDKIKELSEDIIGRKEPSFETKTEDTTEEADSPFKTEAPVPSEDLEEKSLLTFKWPLIALTGTIGVLVIALTGFFLFGKEDSSEKLITISATPEPVRVKPEQAGGISIPDQDKLIYNRIHENTPKVEKLFPEPEKPVLPEIVLNPAENKEEAKTPEVLPPVVIEEVVPEPKKEVLTLPQKPIVVVKEPASKPVEQKSAQKNVPLNWRIQLFSTSKKASAEKAWTDISKKHKALLSDMPHNIASAEIAGKGTFYRLQAGRFATREQANAVCVKLKSQNQDCVPVQAGK